MGNIAEKGGGIISLHYGHLPMQYTEIFSAVKIVHWKKNDIFNILAQNIDCGCTSEPPGEAVLVPTRTHNLCFESKIRRIGIPL